MTSYAVRYLFRLGLWLLVLGLIIIVNSETLASAYMACVSGLELLGYEPRPIGADKLLGPFLSAWFSGASMVQFIALALVTTEFLGFFFLFHLFYALCGLLQHRRACMGNPEEVGAANVRLIRTASEMAILGLCLALMVCWEYSLFKWRAVCGALGIEDPAEAVAMVRSWRNQTAEKGALYAIDIIPLSGLGYIALIIVSAWALEFVLQRMGEDLTQLLSILLLPFHRAWRFLADLFGNQAAQTAPVEGNAPDYDDAAFPVEANEKTSPCPECPEQVEATFPVDSSASESEPARGMENLAPDSEVIGGKPGQRVAFSDALDHPDHYYVHPVTNRIYDKDYWLQLHETEQTA